MHGTEANNLAAIRWCYINPTNKAGLESGTITNSMPELHARVVLPLDRCGVNAADTANRSFAPGLGRSN